MRTFTLLLTLGLVSACTAHQSPSAARRASPAPAGSPSAAAPSATSTPSPTPSPRPTTQVHDVALPSPSRTPSPRSGRPTTRPTTPPGPTPTASRASGHLYAITIQTYMFMPANLSVAVGDTIRATNKDSVDHTWTASGGAWDSGDLATGKAYAFTFTKAGTYSFVCSYHPIMTGSVKVT